MCFVFLHVLSPGGQRHLFLVGNQGSTYRMQNILTNFKTFWEDSKNLLALQMSDNVDKQ